MRRVSFLAVVVALMGALFVSGCADGGGGGNPINPTSVTPAETKVQPIGIILQGSDLPVSDGTVVPVGGSIVVDLEYSLSSEDFAKAGSMTNLSVSVCAGSLVAGTVLITSCDTNGYKPSGRDRFFVSLSYVDPLQRPTETFRLVYIIAKGGFRSSDNAIPPRSGNYLIVDIFDVVKQNETFLRVVWGV